MVIAIAVLKKNIVRCVCSDTGNRMKTTNKQLYFQNNLTTRPLSTDNLYKTVEDATLIGIH